MNKREEAESVKESNYNASGDGGGIGGFQLNVSANAGMDLLNIEDQSETSVVMFV